MDRRYAWFAALALVLLATVAYAANTTPRCRFNYTNSEPENRNWDRVDAILSALDVDAGLGLCVPTTTTTTTSTTTTT